MTSILKDVTGSKFRLLKAGSLGMLKILIKITRTVAPAKKDLYPAWQGMQYMHDMFEGHEKLNLYHNDRYPGMHWTSLRDMLLSQRK